MGYFFLTFVLLVLLGLILQVDSRVRRLEEIIDNLPDQQPAIAQLSQKPSGEEINKWQSSKSST